MLKNLLTICTVLIFTVFIHAQDFQRTVDTEPGKELKVAMTTGGSINVDGWEKIQVKIEVDTWRGDMNESNIDIQHNSKGVFVEVRANGHGRHSGGLDLQVYVPKKYNLELETMGGEISITDVAGKINGQTMGGSLDLRGLSGEIGMTTMGGSIKVRDSRLDGELKTMGGSINFDNVSGNVKATTMGGSVTMTNDKGKGTDTNSEVKISTMGGAIHVDDAPNGADVHTMGGAITIKSAKKYVKAKTMGGAIEIGSVDGWVKATTMGGDITAAMTGDASGPDHSVELSSMGGEVILSLPKNIDANFDIHLVYTRDSRQDYEIRSDFDLNIEEADDDWNYSGGQARKEITGTGKTGTGKHTIYVKTVNGDIIIKKNK